LSHGTLLFLRWPVHRSSVTKHADGLFRLVRQSASYVSRFGERFRGAHVTDDAPAARAELQRELIAANTRDAGPLPVRAVAAVAAGPRLSRIIGVPRSTVYGYLETASTPPVETA
jgi:hypothetical protein